MRAAHTQSVSRRNDTDADIFMMVEPWGMPLCVHPGSTIEAIFEGPAGGACEIDETDEDFVVVYGWPGAKVTVLIDGRQEYRALASPEVPAGMSMKGFLKGLFGAGRERG